MSDDANKPDWPKPDEEKPNLTRLTAAMLEVCHSWGGEDVLVVVCGAWEGGEPFFETGAAAAGNMQKIGITLFNLLMESMPAGEIRKLGQALLAGVAPETPTTPDPAPKPPGKKEWMN